MENGKVGRAYLVAFVAWLSSIVLALKFGAVQNPDLDLLIDLRLPRIVLASSIGMGLSVAGAVIQALFSNPLCEPYTLGISSGSALGAVIGTTLGLQWMFAGIAGTAFLGAIFFAGILYFISLRPGSKSIHLLLAGVMLGFLGSSLVALWVTLSDSNGLQGAIVWLFGDFSRARLKGAILSTLGILSMTLLIWSDWRALDALLLGEEGAESLGVDVAVVRRRIVLLTSLLIGICVSAGGMIGFVGLVVPHFARRWMGSLHLKLIPFCAFLGAITLVLADCLSRVIMQPYELPIGVVTALVGSPLFLWIMLKKQEVS